MYRFARSPVNPMQMRAPMQHMQRQRQPTMPMPAPQAPPLPQAQRGPQQNPMAAMGGMAGMGGAQGLLNLFKSPYEVGSQPDMEEAIIKMGSTPPINPDALVVPQGVAPPDLMGPGGLLGPLDQIQSPWNTMPSMGGLGFLGGLFG